MDVLHRSGSRRVNKRRTVDEDVPGAPGQLGDVVGERLYCRVWRIPFSLARKASCGDMLSGVFDDPNRCGDDLSALLRLAGRFQSRGLLLERGITFSFQQYC